MKLIQISAIIFLMTTGAYAGSFPVSYCTEISAQDRVSSSGAKLTTVGDILAQDRANYYKFGKRDAYDRPSDIFSEASDRAKMIDIINKSSGAFTERDHSRIVFYKHPVKICVDFEWEYKELLNIDTENPAFDDPALHGF